MRSRAFSNPRAGELSSNLAPGPENVSGPATSFPALHDDKLNAQRTRDVLHNPKDNKAGGLSIAEFGLAELPTSLSGPLIGSSTATFIHCTPVA
jgi:hypothetical protein